MDLVNSLLKADVKRANEFKTDVFLSDRLALILDVDSPVEVKIREINSRKFNDIAMYQVDSKGNIDFSRVYDAKLLTCIEGIVEPNLKDKELQSHFGVATAVDLCEKIFKSEVNELSDLITNLSGFADVSDSDVKN